MTIDLEKDHPIIIVVFQGRSHSQKKINGRMKSLKVVVGQKPQIFLPINDKDWEFNMKDQLECGENSVQQSIPGQFIYVPCKCVIIGRYIGIRMEGMMAMLSHAGVWTL